MAKVDAREYAEKWGRRLKSATEDVRRGIERVNEAPGRAAVKQKELLKQRIIEAIDNGTWENQMLRVSLEDWKDAALKKGVNRISAGVDQAMDAQVEMAGKLLDAVDASVSVVNQTARGDLETNIGRMTTFAREMSRRAPRRQRS